MKFGYTFLSLPSLRYALRAHWPVLTGLVLIAVALAVALLIVPALATLHAALVERQRVQQAAAQGAPVPLALPVTALSAQLAPLSTLALVTADMQALAQQNQLQIATVSYQPINDPVLPGVVRIAISARLHGAYLPTKKLAADLLAAYPTLALESVAMRRERALDTVLEVETRWMLFCRTP